MTGFNDVEMKNAVLIAATFPGDDARKKFYRSNDGVSDCGTGSGNRGSTRSRAAASGADDRHLFLCDGFVSRRE